MCCCIRSPKRSCQVWGGTAHLSGAAVQEKLENVVFPFLRVCTQCAFMDSCIQLLLLGYSGLCKMFAHPVPRYELRVRSPASRFLVSWLVNCLTVRFPEQFAGVVKKVSVQQENWKVKAAKDHCWIFGHPLWAGGTSVCMLQNCVCWL